MFNLTAPLSILVCRISSTVKKAAYKIDSYPVHDCKDDGFSFCPVKWKMEFRYRLVDGVVRMEVWLTLIGAFKFIL